MCVCGGGGGGGGGGSCGFFKEKIKSKEFGNDFVQPHSSCRTNLT